MLRNPWENIELVHVKDVHYIYLAVNKLITDKSHVFSLIIENDVFIKYTWKN